MCNFSIGGTPVELEGVGAIAVGCLFLHVFWEVDDHDGVEGALLHGAICAVSKIP